MSRIAVAQKARCKRIRVIMGEKSPCNLCERGQDAGQEVPMRTPKRLYSEERIIYHPELLTCPHCGDLLALWNYLAWDKTVQTLDRVLSLAVRPGHCPQATCPGSRMRLLSAQAQQMAPAGSPYGYGCSPETDASSGLTRSLHGCEQRAHPALLQNLQNLKEQTCYPGAWAISLVACFAMISNTLCQVIAQLYTLQNPSV